jgi:ankyrin repeat protein
MDSLDPETAAVVAEARSAMEADDAAAIRALFGRHERLRALVDAPLGPFDSPAVVNVRSRAMLDALLEAGADIDARSRWWAGGFGLLDCAPPEVAAYAIDRGATVDAHAAARLGLIETLRGLVAGDPGVVHARGGDGQTPLHAAGGVEAARLLLDHGADIDALDVDHESTPVQYMSGDRHEVARYLVSRGCRTDLLLAAALGDLDLIGAHLDAVPDAIRVRVIDDDFPKRHPRAGGTIYRWALGFCVSAHQVARRFGHEAARALLVERSPIDVRLIEACWAGDADGARLIHGQHPGIAAGLSGRDRRQVAHAACANQGAAVALMLECGWPVDARGQHQATPLHWAAFHGNAAMTAAILRFAPPLEATDADFTATPLGWALHGSTHGWHVRTGDFAATIELLVQAGATRPEAG